ncbi:hypothetical protein Slin15195_G079480 [Septoria linicola]|uniref:Uncharacterized protein n=1 Tax=Septoria linicola TaxID=215465 RepID=A0A9Q9ELQ9_9PEZI|nr:hypothetical protein Slin14017_G040680 [Septoria linicola]USW54629.1 hypothetical protein Slin15195_G079480 [Septoria linicola]
MSVVNGGSLGGEEAAKGGTKRKHDSVAQNDYERFAKRFNLLNLEPSAKGVHSSSSYYIPISSTTSDSATTKASIKTPVPRASSDELMQVDETRDRVYIHDLDAELADIESDDEKLIFLPDIEKHFSKIPKHVLTGRSEDVEGQELVLYNVPKSLTVDEGHDAVRKAILEARQRAREKAAEEARQQDMDRQYGQAMSEPTETAHGYSAGYATELESVDDPDAMDMD